MNLWTFLAVQPVYFLVLATVLGLLVGSFLNVLVHRLPIMLERQWQREAQEVLDLPLVEHERFNLSLPASHCPHCGHRIRPWENIPLLSYLLLRGRCSACKGRSVRAIRWWSLRVRGFRWWWRGTLGRGCRR